MSKWFESANLANYAKTALLQAQKQIDKVLDIKEDEILGKLTTTTSDSNIEITINDQFAITTNNNSKPKFVPSAPTTTQNENDFFSNFLTNNRSSSPLISDESSSISARKHTKSKASSTSSISIVKEPEIEFDTFLNQETNSSSNLKSNSSASLEHDTTNTTKPIVKTNSSKSAVNKQLEIEKLEKKNWIQNYVDSNGGNDATPTPIVVSNSNTSSSNSTSSSSNTVSLLQQQASLIEDEDTNKTVINESTEQYQQQINEDCINITSLNASSLNESFQKVNDSYHSNSTNNECITIEATLVDTTIASSSSNNINNTNYDRDDLCISNLNEDNERLKLEQSSSLIQVEPEKKNTMTEAPSPTSSNDGSSDEKAKLGNEYIKVDSSASINSGHASSAEEHETCASSDIEVISLPSTNGDQLNKVKNNNNHFKSPLIMVNKKVNNHHKPKEDHQQITYIKSPPPDQTPDQQATSNLLEAREAQILKLNKQNVKLQEENDNNLNELEKLKFESIERFKTMQQAQTDLNARCEQFHIENEKFKKINADLNREFIEFQKQLKEKDEQIEQLKQEGLKLSKQELTQSNIIKKLRTKEKENDESLQILRSDNAKLQKELDELKKILDLKEENEKQTSETFKKLEKGAGYLEKELLNAKSMLEDSQEKVTSLENTLQNTFKELAELHRLNAAKDSRINEATSSIENQFKEEIQAALDKERLIANKKQESLKWELQSVRSDISRLEHQHSLREDMLRKEIADLQQQLRDTEMRNNELSQNISTATRPLLRQIENLQSSHSNQIELLENAERNLIERLKESQGSCCDLSEKNRYNKEQLIEMQQQIKTYEAQINTLKTEKSKINAEYQMAKTSLDTYENEKYEKEAQQKLMISSLQQQIERMTKEKKSLEAQLDMEKIKVENESKRLQTLMNDLAKERELQQQQKLMNSSSSSIDSLSSTPNASTPTNHNTNSFSFSQRVASNQSNDNNNSRYDLIQSMQSGGAFSVLESLQSKLKQKDGEINQLQKEIQNLERIRESMAKELVNLSNKLDFMQQQLRNYPSLQENYNKLNMEYNALLQMYGEKSEETEELKLDLQDVKEMYRLQIEDLIKRSNLS